MKIDDKDINKLLNEFKCEEIVVPKNLEDKLNKKLQEINPKNKRNSAFIRLSITGALILIISYSAVPSFRSFANDIFKYILGDIGIENAINNGYKNVESQVIKIGEYDIDIDNIYIDDLRISFDATIKKALSLEQNNTYEESYTLYASNEKYEGISWTCNSFDYNEKNEYKSNIQLIGDGIGKLLKDNPYKINLELRLNRTYTDIENNKEVIKEELVGRKEIELDISKNIYNSKEIDINKKIIDENIKLNINSLTISPTMMYLNTNGETKDGSMIGGLYNLKIISEKNKIYNENLSLWGSGNKYGYDQTIVPSIYYDKSKYINILADGINVTPDYKDIEIKIDDKYPKKIEYFNTIMYIEKVVYKDGILSVYVRGNDRVNHASSCKVDGEYDGSGGMYTTDDGYNVYSFEFEVDRKSSYMFSLSMVMKYEIPINIKLNIKN